MYLPTKIALMLDKNKHAQLFASISSYLFEMNSPEKAVRLLLSCNRLEDALSVFESKGIPFTLEMYNLIDFTNYKGQEEKILHASLAELCSKNGLHNAASVEYAKIGNRAKAMDSLLKTGDLDKIITFASKVAII